MFYILKEKETNEVKHYRNTMEFLEADCKINNINKEDYILVENEQEPKLAYDGKIYLAEFCPAEPLSNIKEQKKQEINRARENAREKEGASFANDLFDIDEKSQANITAIVSMLIANNIPDAYKSVYRSKTNKDLELTKVQMIELGTTIGAKVSEIYQKSWELKARADNATTKEEIEAIVW